MRVTGSVSQGESAHIEGLPNPSELVSSPTTLPVAYQDRPFLIVEPWTPDTDLVVKYVEEFLEAKPWGHDEHPIPGPPKPTGPIQTVDQLIAHWHAHYEQFVHSLLPPGKKFMPHVLVEGENTELEIAIIDTPCGPASKIGEIHASLVAHTDSALNDEMFDAIDEFYAGGGEAWVFTDTGRATMAHPFSVWIRRWPASMFGEWGRWITPLSQGMIHIVDSAVVSAVLGHAYQTRTNGNRHVSVGYNDAERVIRYSHSEGRRRDGTLVPAHGPTSPLMTKLLAHAFINPLKNRSPDDGMSLHVLNMDAWNESASEKDQ